MRHSRKLVLISLLFAACGTSSKLFQPVEADVQHASANGKTTDMASLQKGYTLYQQHCSGCHALVAPPRRSMEQWNHILPKMFPKTKLTEQERGLVQSYIEARR
jgi:mono/diheme cytochrome c family protein